MFSGVPFRWDTGEVERMSPWDLQPVTEHGGRLCFSMDLFKFE